MLSHGAGDSTSLNVSPESDLISILPVLTCYIATGNEN